MFSSSVEGDIRAAGSLADGSPRLFPVKLFLLSHFPQTNIISRRKDAKWSLVGALRDVPSLDPPE